MNKKSRRNNCGYTYDDLRSIAYDRGARVHFVGIGGVSMYSLALLTMRCGAEVSGSDRADSERVRDLIMLGARVSIGHFQDSVKGASLVVYSHAIQGTNAELRTAESDGIPTVSRAEYMAALMLDYSLRIGVSGSHGKSTTVAILECIFARANRNPTVLSGANLPCGSPYRMGSKNLMIYEACEYKDSFLKFTPDIAVGLNLELDHPDYFESLEALKSSFSKALGKAREFALICGDDNNLRDIIPTIPCRVITFGSRAGNDYRYSITAFLNGGFDFTVSRFGNTIGSFRLNIPGAYNVHNATAAITVALEQGIDVESIAEAVASFSGIDGRLQYIGNRLGRPVYLDYAHHPTEIRSVIDALRMLTARPITVVFKPHTFSRTEALWTDFIGALSLADYPVITDIFPAREDPIPGITSERLACEIGGNARYCPDDDVISLLDRHTDGAILLMGAGDFTKIKKEIIKIH